MRTVYDVKKAKDYDTMINVVYESRAEAATAAKTATKKIKRKRNTWKDLFPLVRM